MHTRVGDTACEATAWVSDAEVSCAVASGTRRAAETVGASIGSMTDVAWFDAPSITTHYLADATNS